MHPRLLTNFLLRRRDLVFGPALHRLPPQQPQFIDQSLFNGVGLLEISLRVHYSKRDRDQSIPQTRVRLKNCQKCRIAEFRRRRHWPTLHHGRIANIRRITLNRTPARQPARKQYP